MGKRIGSQYRETLDESGYILIGEKCDEAILFDTVTDNYELWVRRDDFAGWVVEIGGGGYEFVRTETKEDKQRLGC